MLKTWGFADCKPLAIPGEVTSVELPEESKPKVEDIHRAQKLAGSLIWLSTRTRPDIVYSQSRISSMATEAPIAAIKEGQRVLRYLQGTKNLGLQFKACNDFQQVIGYTFANFSAKRSQTGAVIKLGANVITWRSMKQSEVPLSSAESEVQASASTAVLAEYVRTLRESLSSNTYNRTKVRPYSGDSSSDR